ncbi:hypothetical protein RRF57_012565 [Xylaria bambusicola]|uniref:Uncharacterized protein n=1 Tax=Xylaria bambusicola TaxID=326684 RepID=A0AAN7UWQ6_9PEZI
MTAGNYACEIQQRRHWAEVCYRLRNGGIDSLLVRDINLEEADLGARKLALEHGDFGSRQNWIYVEDGETLHTVL